VEQTADRVIIVDRGRVLAEESLGTLRRKNGAAWNLENYYMELVR